MILNNSLYHIIDSSPIEDGSADYRVRISAECPIYAAHFPGLPVTPGVCLLMIGKELLAHAVGRKLHLVEVKNAKFLSVVSPMTDEMLSCHLRKIALDDTLHEVQAQIVLGTDEEVKAKASIKCLCP